MTNRSFSVCPVFIGVGGGDNTPIHAHARRAIDILYNYFPLIDKRYSVHSQGFTAHINVYN